MKKKLKTHQVITIVLLFITSNIASAQSTSGSNASNELLSLIDIPTAGVLQSGNLAITFDVLPLGVFLTKIELGIFQNFSLGISYGASNLIGFGKPDWYIRPGFHAKFRLFTETRSIPSFTLGFNSQGKGTFFKNSNRYEIKSPGAFFSVTKNYKFLGYISFHGIMNYSLEKGDKNINFGAGIEKTIGPTVSFIAEYDFALNDNSPTSFGDQKGYLNAGIRWSASKVLTIGFDFRNILENKKQIIKNGIERALFIEYVKELY
jgi:hypothetical protein